MFSLIITIISIALVAALALATLYYGGAAFNKSAATADATKLLNQSTQLRGAAELYKADTGEYPLSLDDMVAQNYLSSIPVAAAQPAPVDLMGTAQAAGTPWVMVLAGYPVFAVTSVTEAVCKSINKQAYGVEGILKTARSAHVTQCYGTDVNSLKMVTAKTGAMLATVAASPSAVIALGPVTGDPIPTAESTDTSDAGWLVAPGAALAGGPLTYLDAGGSAVTGLEYPNTLVGDYFTVPFSVKNTSAAPLTLDPASASALAPFFVSLDGCSGVTLAPNDTCAMEVDFEPTTGTTYSGASRVFSLQVAGASVSPLPLHGRSVDTFKFSVTNLKTGAVFPFLTSTYGMYMGQVDAFHFWTDYTGTELVFQVTNISSVTGSIQAGQYTNTSGSYTLGYNTVTTCGGAMPPGTSCFVTIPDWAQGTWDFPDGYGIQELHFSDASGPYGNPYGSPYFNLRYVTSSWNPYN